MRAELQWDSAGDDLMFHCETRSFCFMVLMRNNRNKSFPSPEWSDTHVR